jgi:hypothetical protein
MLTESGLDLTVDEEVLALTASFDGGMLVGIFLTSVSPAFGEAVKLFTDDAYAHIKEWLTNLKKQEGPTHFDVFAREKTIDARIENDLPPKAFLRLQGKLPPAPSGRIVYNRKIGQWEDSGELEPG